jgi:RHS repeat-associated protein
MVLTQETHTGYNTATMEQTRAGTEEPIFGQQGTNNEVAKSRFAVSSIPGQTAGGGWQNTGIGSYVSKLSKLTNTVGPNSLLKVMSGDVITATTQYYYQNAAVNTSGSSLPANVLASLAQAIGGGAATAGSVAHSSTVANAITGGLGAVAALASAIAPNATATDNIPKAYLTVLFFDERFNFVSEGSTTLRVGGTTGAAGSSLTLPNIAAPKNGYVYVYVSNESNEPVYFDNFKVSDTRGRITEENHYYAYGLRIAGISSKKLGDVNEGMLQNQYQWQGDFNEFDEDISWNDFELRNYDPQVGRFVQQDPYDQYASGYVGMGNDPVNLIDPSGGLSFNFGTINTIGRIGVAMGGAVAGYIIDKSTGGNGWKGAAIGGAVALAGTFIPPFLS